MRKNKRWLLIIPVACFIGILWNSFSQPGLNDFTSNFEECVMFGSVIVWYMRKA